MVEIDVVYELDLKVKHEARNRRAESDAVLETVYEMILNEGSKSRTAVYTMEEEPGE